MNSRQSPHTQLKAGVHMKAVFWLVIMALTQIPRLRFKQSGISMLIPHIYVLGSSVNFLVIFRYIWREIVFLKGLVKQLPTNLGCHCGVRQLSGGVLYAFPPFQSLFKLP